MRYNAEFSNQKNAVSHYRKPSFSEEIRVMKSQVGDVTYTVLEAS